MTRRVNWVRFGPKVIRGDCIVINFNNQYLAGDLLRLIPNTPSSEICALPLGFFCKTSRPFQPAHPKPNTFYYSDRPLSLCLPQASLPVPLTNRFALLEGLSECDWLVDPHISLPEVQYAPLSKTNATDLSLSPKFQGNKCIQNDSSLPPHIPAFTVNTPEFTRVISWNIAEYNQKKKN